MRRSALLGHLIAGCDFVLRARATQRRGGYSKVQTAPRVPEHGNTEHTSLPFIATQFSDLTSTYGPLVIGGAA